MCDYQRGARSIKLFSVKILPTKPGKSLDYMPSALLKFLLQCGALGSCLQKSINANKNQRGARYIKFFFVKILPLTCSVIKTLRIQFRALGSCLQKSINANKNQRGARYIKFFFVKILLLTCSVIKTLRI